MNLPIGLHCMEDFEEDELADQEAYKQLYFSNAFKMDGLKPCRYKLVKLAYSCEDDELCAMFISDVGEIMNLRDMMIDFEEHLSLEELKYKSKKFLYYLSKGNQLRKIDTLLNGKFSCIEKLPLTSDPVFLRARTVFARIRSTCRNLTVISTATGGLATNAAIGVMCRV